MDNQQMHLNPGAYAVYVFGSYQGVALALGVPRSQPYRWANGRKEGAGIGLIPPRAMRKILDVARERSLDITANDLVYGREVVEASGERQMAPAVVHSH